MGVFSSSYETTGDPRGKEAVIFVSSASQGLFCSTLCLNDEHLNPRPALCAELPLGKCESCPVLLQPPPFPPAQDN